MLDHPLSGAITLGFALVFSLLSHNWHSTLPQIIAIAIIFSFNPYFRKQSKWLIVSLIIAATIFLAWWIPANNASFFWTKSWLLNSNSAFVWPNFHTTFNILRDLPWFIWPTWPLAILALWRWRKWLKSVHIIIPSALLGSALAVLFFTRDPFEPEFSSLVIPCAILAAFALPTLKRGVVNALDMFAIMCFSLTAATVWLGWVALQIGWPEQIAHNIARQTHGLDTHVALPATILAILGTITWIVLVIWRLKSHPAGLWRGTVLSAGGLITTWLLLATLWMPPLDYARSYREVSSSLSNVLADVRHNNECIRAVNLGRGQRASFLVFSNLEFSSSGECNLLLQQLDPDDLENNTAGFDSYITLWEGRRTPDRHEMFRLLRKNN